MLTEGPAPDPKCKLIIASFLTLSHLLDCLICVRNAMSIVFLLQMIGVWDRWVTSRWLIFIMVWLWGGGDGVCYNFIVFVFFLCFCILLSHVLSRFI